MPCYRIKTQAGGFAILCGKLGRPCMACGGVAGNQCDYPVGRGKTCDRQLCDDCAHQVAPNVHYCAGHFREWERFREAGGVEAVLANVVPFQLSPPPGHL